jgi:hypothetical protein
MWDLTWLIPCTKINSKATCQRLIRYEEVKNLAFWNHQINNWDLRLRGDAWINLLLWEMMQCSPVDRYQCFGGPCHQLPQDDTATVWQTIIQNWQKPAALSSGYFPLKMVAANFSTTLPFKWWYTNHWQYMYGCWWYMKKFKFFFSYN